MRSGTENSNIQEIWNWYSDVQGRIISVSSGFTSCFGHQANKQIIGHSFWNFADGLDKPINGWETLSDSFKNKTRIKKFVFSYTYQGKPLKIGISGEPLYEKGKYIGYKGNGYIADENEISSPEIAQNLLSISLDNLNIGIAIFGLSSDLREFNEIFMMQMINSGVRLQKGMTYETLISYLKGKNKYVTDLSFNETSFSSLYFQKEDLSILSLKKTLLDNGLIVIRSEIDENLSNKLKEIQKSSAFLQESNKVYEKKIEEYRLKLSHSINQEKIASGSSDDDIKKDDEIKKIVNFYENNLDVGILITNSEQVIETINYVAAQMFGYPTATSMITDSINMGETEFLNYLKDRNERVSYLLEQGENRFQHKINLKNINFQGVLKEVITFYPSVYNPQKIISFFYYEENKTEDALLDHTQAQQELKRIQEQFTRYMCDDIKSSVNIISGYNELQTIVHGTSEVSQYSNEINLSCHAIVTLLNEMMQLYKITTSSEKIEETVYLMEDQLSETIHYLYEKANEKKITLSLDVIGEVLYIVTDKELFFNILKKIISCLITGSKENSLIRIQLKSNYDQKKMSIVISDESSLNLASIYNSDLNQLIVNPRLRSTGALNLKIAEVYIKILGFEVKVNSFEEGGNILTIEIPPENLLDDYDRDKDILAI